MPGIVLFNRRWSFGSDDLVYPGLLEIFFRAAWLIAVSVVYFHHRHGFMCSTGHLLSIIFQIVIASLVIHIISASSVVWCSTRGTILDTDARKKVPLLIYIKLLLVIPELAAVCISLYWAFLSHEDCSLDVVITVKAAIFTECGVAIVVMVGTLILFDPVGELRSGESGDKRRHDGLLAQKTRKVWERRIKFLCCCFAGDQHSRMAFKDIAESITVFFKDMDVVPTDIAAGLLLLYHAEERRRRYSTLPPINSSINQHAQNETETETEPTEILIDSQSTEQRTPENGINGSRPHAPFDYTESVDSRSYDAHNDWTSKRVLVHYMRFALACYGWPLYVMMHLKTGCCQVVGCCRCCCNPYDSDNAAIEDNCFQSNMTAILKFTGLTRDDVLYASFHNQVYQVPFYVALDHKEKSVVVAIRGTMSVRDLLTDLTSGSDELDVCDDRGEPCKGHKGMAQAAHYVVNELDRLNLLTDTFSKYPSYRLVITGHSLGAGTATVMSLLLRGQYPTLKVYAYSPPAILSKPMVGSMSEFVCSVVVGTDLVARLSFITMLGLRDRIHQQLRHSTQPKYKILASGLWYVICGLPCALERSLFHRDDTTQQARAPLLADETRESSPNYDAMGLTTDDESDGGQEIQTVPLYPPGKILHITNITRVAGGSHRDRFSATWCQPTDFHEISVHPMMLFDHLPDMVYRTLHKLEKQERLHHSGSDEDC